jgi:FO synthase subunit 2
VKQAAPDLHVHAFSPEEIKYGANLAGVPFRAYLEALKDAGLGSVPGTSAEILDDGVRKKIAPGRITTAEWVEVIEAAHAVGLPTTATIMFGHVETHAERLRHLDLLRSMQASTGGFTELVPLSFVHEEAPMTVRRQIPGLRPGPTGNDVVRLFAVSRLLLGRSFRNLQVSWVKEGLRNGQMLLACGANDLGGTLMNESISTAAGAAHGQLVTPAALRRVIRDAGRVPVERDTRYRALRTFSPELDAVDGPEPLDAVEDSESVFGSYEALTRDPRFRFRLGLAPQPA